MSITTTYHDLESGEPLGSLWDIASAAASTTLTFSPSSTHASFPEASFLSLPPSPIWNGTANPASDLVESGELKDLLTGLNRCPHVEDWFDNRHRRIIGHTRSTERLSKKTRSTTNQVLIWADDPASSALPYPNAGGIVSLVDRRYTSQPHLDPNPK